MRKKKNFFDKELQVSARRQGKYDEIAANVGKCVFCDLREKYIITREKGLVLTVNVFPYINGHLLIVPERHIENYLKLTKDEMVVYHRLARKGITLLREKLKVDGVWLLLRDGQLAEKTVKHLHWQVMPYTNGLVNWHYQKIDISPEELAKKLRRKK